MSNQASYDAAQCDGEVFEKGTVVAVFAMPKDACESLCLGLSALTGSRVDWSYMGGRNVVRCLGDVERVRTLIHEIHYANGGPVTP